MEQPSDIELWQAAASGSEAAFGDLFDRHYSSVYNYCFRRIGDWSAAEDLMSATFLEAWRKKELIRLSGDSLRPWLLGVATNLIRNHRRANRRLDAALKRVTPESSHDGLADDVAERVDDERRMRRLLELVSRMSEREREVIALVLWSGLTYEEAAVALDIAVGTVKSRLSRARRRLMELAAVTGHDTGEDNCSGQSFLSPPIKVEG
jgi:RNA polymerase sigma-70 factor (ECF subfamily)